MNENEFKYNGKTYVAVGRYPDGSYSCDCDLCAFREKECKTLIEDGIIPHCHYAVRKDGRNAYFELKEETK